MNSYFEASDYSVVRSQNKFKLVWNFLMKYVFGQSRFLLYSLLSLKLLYVKTPSSPSFRRGRMELVIGVVSVILDLYILFLLVVCLSSYYEKAVKALERTHSGVASHLCHCRKK